MKGSNNERKDYIKGQEENPIEEDRSKRDKEEDTIIDTETGSRRRTSMLSLSLLYLRFSLSFALHSHTANNSGRGPEGRRVDRMV